MAQDHDQRATAASAILDQVRAAISGKSAGEMKDLLSALTARMLPDDPLSAPPPSRRRPRRCEVATYLVRVQLTGTKPPVWRRLELPSDLFLDQVHEAIQIAFGWTGGHLHEFGSGPSPYHPATELYLCQYQIEEDDAGIPESDVRLDEVLVDPGDTLFYTYDFGDSWRHTIKLEAVQARKHSARGVCLAGRRDGPAEDCGGVHAYELITATLDPANRDHVHAVTEFAQMYGDGVDPASMQPIPFDIEQVNTLLAALDWPSDCDAAGRSAGPQDNLPPRLAELVGAVRLPAGQRELRRLLRDASLDQPVLVDARTAARMVHPYGWLLNRVGSTGIRLTQAGYLPPACVAAAVTDLGFGQEWLGTDSREHHTPPVLHLRESATAAGLLRKRNGTLLLTTRGRALCSDPVALWWHLAERMPPGPRDRCETYAGLILLAVLAGRAPGDPDETVARLLSAIGWSHSDGTALDALGAAGASWHTKFVLRLLGALQSRPGLPAETLTSDGALFARAALRRWPAG